jgi:hypothetical protein
MATINNSRRHGSYRTPAVPSFDESAAYRRLEKALAEIRPVRPDVAALLREGERVPLISGGHDWDTGDAPAQTWRRRT